MAQDNVTTLGATQIPIGLSQVIRIQPTPFQISTVVKIGSGGSLELVPIQLSGSSTAAGNAWGKGYLFGTTEAFGWVGGAAAYFAATGATVVAHVVCGYTAGATFL